MRRILKYLLLTFAITAFLDAAALSVMSHYPLAAKLLLALRTAVPALGTALISLAYFGELSERLLHPSFAHRYLIHSITLPVVIVLIASLVTILVNERVSLPSVSFSELKFSDLPRDELVSLMLMVSGFLSGMTINALASLVEEIGWRGLMLEETIRYGFIKSSLITGIAWGTWRLPMGFVYTKVYPKHVDALGLLTFLSLMLAISLILTWLRVRSRSLYPVALFSGILWSLSNSFAFFLRVEDEILGFPYGLPQLLSSMLVLASLIGGGRISSKKDYQ
ncbi:MAG: CPBP family intramembrane glutamic endopeptidase [Candidatus Korarchaeum sp.]|nr:CPBP family intramembrane glutamic endopeptidase [Candidatus Korarchaeum sp.]